MSRETDLLVYTSLLTGNKSLKDKAIDAVAKEIIELLRDKNAKAEKTLQALRAEIINIRYAEHQK